MKLRAAAAALAVLTATLGLGSGAAAAAPTATYRAAASRNYCVVEPDTTMDCFAQKSDFVARTQKLNSKFASSSSSSSSCPVFLFTGANYTGRSLGIYAQGQWLNLSNYGFDNATVSFIGNGCGFHLADYQWGGGYWYPGYTGPWAYCGNMGSGWNYRVSSVYVA